MNYIEKVQTQFLMKGPYWNLCTPGEKMVSFINSKEEFCTVMAIIADSLAAFDNLRILSFTIMNNHLHFLLAGTEQNARAFFEKIKVRIVRYFTACGYPAKYFDVFSPTLFPVESWQHLKTLICYNHRNPMVAGMDYLPWTYPWGTGDIYFNHQNIRQGIGVKASELPVRKQRELFHARNIMVKDALVTESGYVLPESFCAIEEGESYFENSREYFVRLTKDSESSRMIARQMGDSIILTDEELQSVAFSITSKEYPGQRLFYLPPAAKIELSKKLHFDYNATNKQLARVLHLDIPILEQLFPSSH